MSDQLVMMLQFLTTDFQKMLDIGEFDSEYFHKTFMNRFDDTPTAISSIEFAAGTTENMEVRDHLYMAANHLHEAFKACLEGLPEELVDNKGVWWSIDAINCEISEVEEPEVTLL